MLDNKILSKALQLSAALNLDRLGALARLAANSLDGLDDVKTLSDLKAEWL